MSRIRKVLEQIDPALIGIDPEKIKVAFQKKIDKSDFEDVTVSEVDVDLDGDIIVTFEDGDGTDIDILFTYDSDEGTVAILIDEPQNDEFTTLDLDSLQPVLKKTQLGIYVDLQNLSWLNVSTLEAILRLGEFSEVEDDDDGREERDAFGHEIPGGTEPLKTEAVETPTDALWERSLVVVRGGKRVKLGVVRKRKKKRLTSKQKAGILKGVRKRKSKKGQIARTRKKSLKLRKRLNLKTKPKNTKLRR
jgi:hypothetical protein